MRVIITGANGQVGQALLATAADAMLHNVTLIPLTRAELDLAQPGQIGAALSGVAADVIINCAAYTAVDRAESEPDLALSINGAAVAALRSAADAMGARLVQISTDFVFDGQATAPIATDATPAPLSVYGHSKLAGERAAGDDALIIRTAWVHAAVGANFVNTMLRLMAERDVVRVVGDQLGSPTYATHLARGIWGLVAHDARGIYHYTNDGVTSWHDFALAIRAAGIAAGLLDSGAAQVEQIGSVDYPTPARRPAYSALDCRATDALLGTARPHWRDGLAAMIEDKRRHG
jgi:dTDP-4-dehydrorhamnose reductase